MPRLLVIRVGARWYERGASDRRDQARAWHDLWRQNVPGGIVSILDAETGAPAVQFGRDGQVLGVTAKSPAGDQGRGGRP